MVAIADSFAVPRRARVLIETVAIAVLLGAGVHRLAEPLAVTYEGWRAGLGLYSYGAFPPLHAYSLTAWLAGLAVCLIVVCTLGRRWFSRALAVAIGVLVGAQLAVDHLGGRELTAVDVVIVTAILAASVWVALGRASTPTRRWLAVPFVVASFVAIGFPAIAVTWGNLTQHHPPFLIETYAAYQVLPDGTHVITVDPDPEIVDVGGERWEIDRRDGLRLTAEDVGLISRAGDRVVLHITNREKARALARRSARRISQADALFINGHRLGFSIYDDLLIQGVVSFGIPDHADVLWAALGSPE